MGLICSNIFSHFTQKKQQKLVMIGLEAAGKTTILYKLKLEEPVKILPTIDFNLDTVEYNYMSFTVWDLGAQGYIKRLWRHYYEDTKGLIFVVDSSDHDRFEEASWEFQNMLQEEQLRDAILLILANKQDLPEAMPVQEITEKLGLNTLTDRTWKIQSTCAKSGTGLYEGLDWLSDQLSKR